MQRQTNSCPAPPGGSLQPRRLPQTVGALVLFPVQTIKIYLDYLDLCMNIIRLDSLSHLDLNLSNWHPSDALSQCATFIGNSYQTFGLATDKTYQTELNLTGPNKNNDFFI